MFLQSQPKKQLSDCPIFVAIEGIYKFKQVSILSGIFPNTEDEQVLGAVHVALSTDTCQGKLILANFHIFKQAELQQEQYIYQCIS